MREDNNGPGGRVEHRVRSMADSTDDARVSEGGNESTSSKANAKPAAASKEKRKVTGGKVAVPEVLKFTSWWDEDREESSLGNGSSAGGGLKRRYVSLKFYCADGTFDVRCRPPPSRTRSIPLPTIRPAPSMKSKPEPFFVSRTWTGHECTHFEADASSTSTSVTVNLTSDTIHTMCVRV